MSLLEPLLEILDLDLAAEAARARSSELPERAALPQLQAERTRIEAEIAAAEVERVETQAEEERLGSEVSQLARDIETADLERYSGKRMDRDEAAAHDASQHELRERKDALEAQELALLERLEAVEQRLESASTVRSAKGLEIERAERAICAVEAEVASEIARLLSARERIAPKIPPVILAAYDRVREQPRAGGRGAAPLKDGRCGACRIALPSHVKAKMLAEPDDALIQCPQCRRVLVR